MKRDWKVIKELLNELEPLHEFNGLNLQVFYSGDRKSSENDLQKMYWAKQLISKNYISGIVNNTIDPDGYTAISNMNLTFDGHDLLEKLNDDTLWKKIEELAKDQGIKLTFSTLGILAQKAITSIIT